MYTIDYVSRLIILANGQSINLRFYIAIDDIGHIQDCQTIDLLMDDGTLILPNSVNRFT